MQHLSRADRSAAAVRAARAIPTFVFALGFLASTVMTSTGWAAIPAAASPLAIQGATPVPGEIAISEILFDSGTPVDDNDGEYFEVTNISNHAIDLSGLFVQDLETVGSSTAPYFMIPAGALLPIYPGESLVFARSGDSAANGGIPKVDYAYAVPTGGAVPPDKSKVSHTAMALNNSAIDAIAITQGAPLSQGGFVIEMVTYDPTKAPFTNHAGIGFERSDLMGPWAPANVAASTASFGSVPQKGSPGAMNTNDTTLYSTWYHYVPVNPGAADGGVLLASGPASFHAGAVHLKLSGGPANALFALGISVGPADVPFFDGTALIDFGFAGFWAEPNQQFDAAGDATLEAPLTPSLVGQQFYLQWYSYDANNGSFRFSNGLGVDIVP